MTFALLLVSPPPLPPPGWMHFMLSEVQGSYRELHHLQLDFLSLVI